MKLKRLVIFTVVACLIFGTPVSAAKAKWLKKNGKYEATIDSHKLKGKNKKKYYKKKTKYCSSKTPYIIKTKVKKRSITMWGTLEYKKSGKKKFLKYRKYKFKLSKNIVFLSNTPNWGAGGGYHWEKQSNREGRKYLKHGYGLYYTLYVKHGVVYKIKNAS